jgi:Raf kinase inhibitor-like YbhB/YbcL family protein
MRAVLAGLLFVLLGCSQAQAGPLAYQRDETQTSGKLTLTSEAFLPGAAIPVHYSAYDDGVSPPLAWTGAPADTRSFVLLVEDPDATSAKPYVHWMAWNIAPERSSLPEAVAAAAPGMVQGRNNHGDNAWFGPRPRGGSAHHYYFQLFALDTMLVLPAAASRNDLLEAMDGHVLAAGRLLGMFAKPAG